MLLEGSRREKKLRAKKREEWKPSVLQRADAGGDGAGEEVAFAFVQEERTPEAARQTLETCCCRVLADPIKLLLDTIRVSNFAELRRLGFTGSRQRIALREKPESTF